jgi:hypothetical protein
MMIARKDLPWGFVEVRFAVNSPPGAAGLRILQAHAAILEALALLDVRPEQEPQCAPHGADCECRRCTLDDIAT